ncbi:putative methyltransferase domain containing protein [Trypanosoma cruzi]|nr:putative methyltransferase domain containing protein [Trypanosoma cruzi]
MIVLNGISEEQKKLAVVGAAAAFFSSAVTAAVVRVLSRQPLKAVEEPPPVVKVATEKNKCASEAREEKKEGSEMYKSELCARQYMEFHYTPSRTSYAQRLRTISESFDFPQRMAQKFKEFFPEAKNEQTRALEIGCATGASVLEMSKYFDSVIGVDYSEIFIHFAQEVLRENSVPHVSRVSFGAVDQGDIEVTRHVRLSHGLFPKRCQFFWGDAMNLLGGGGGAKANLVGRHSSRYDDVSWYQVPAGELFDGVLVSNILCRVSDPRKLLDTLPRLLRKGGILVLASPYSWSDGITPKSKWIGGLPDGPRSEDVVKEILMKNFELLNETDEAFLIRDHVRRYQLGFSHCTVWRRS